MDAERALISKIAQTGKGLESLMADGINKTHFADEQARDIWEYMVGHARRYRKPPTFSTLRERFGDYNWEMNGEPVEYIRDRFIEGIERRGAIEFSRELAVACNDPQYAGRLGEFMLEKSRDLHMLLPGQRAHRFSDMSERIELYRKRREEGGYGGMTLGIPKFDAATLGIQDHELVSIVGWQGTGKSTLAQWVFYNIWQQGKTSLLISLEMGHEALFRKWDQMVLQAESYMKLKSLNLSDEEEERYAKFAEMLRKQRAEGAEHDMIVIDDIRDCTVEKVYGEIMRHRPDIVAIDYITLMETPGLNNSSRWEKLTWLTRQLKQVAMATKTPLISIAQTSRDSEREGATMSNIGGTYSIGADSDIVIGLHQDDEMRANYQMEARLLKNRDGERVVESVFWDMGAMAFFAPYSDYQHLKYAKTKQIKAVEDEPAAEEEEATG